MSFYINNSLKYKKMIKKVPLYVKIIIGLVFGIIWALLSGWYGWQDFTSDWIAPFGTIFINLLKLIAVPLILFSIISGIVSLGNPKDLGKLGLRTLSLYLFTTVFAVSLGLLLVNVIKPGKLISKELRMENRISYELWAQKEKVNIKDGKHYLQDPNYKDVVQSKMEKAGTEVADESTLPNIKAPEKSGPLQALVDMVPSNIFEALTKRASMLQIIFFAIFFGIALLYIPKDKAKPVIQFVDGCSEIFIKMVDIVMRGAPFFVFALMAGVVNKIAGDSPNKIVELFKGLGWYSLTVLVGLVLMAFVIYPLILKILVPSRKVGGFIKGISSAQALAFSTSSSAATLPVTMECVEENLGVKKKTAGFVLPIGATINMDGTSLYQAIAVVFLAQLHLIDLNFGQQVTIVLTATLASIGSAAVPSAGLVMLMVVLTSVDLNPGWIAIIMPVDRILDMVRTVVNVTGDACVASVMDKFVQEDAKENLDSDIQLDKVELIRNKEN